MLCFSFEFGGYLGGIDELYISPMFRNQGIGKAFIRHLEKRAKEKNCVAMFLVVTEENKKVEELYKKLNYTALNRTEFIKPLSYPPTR